MKQEEHFYRKLGEEIRSARLKKGITQENFGEMINRTRGNVILLETGMARPTAYLVYKIKLILELA